MRGYLPGDGRAWAEIETAVGEFPRVDEAERCHAHYLAHAEELARRQFFVCAPDGRPVATATAWWTGEGASRVPVVHALACLPAFQGAGLGRVVATRMLEAFYALEGRKDVWLETQTWSHRAICLYLKLGFVPLKTGGFGGAPNEYEAARKVLARQLPPEALRMFDERAR